MKAVRIIALKKDRKRLLEHLQDSSLVHVRHTDECESGFSRTDTSAQLQQFDRNAALTEQALKILDGIAPEKKGLLASFKGRRVVEPEEIGKLASQSVKVIGICNKICDLDKQAADFAAERIRLRTAMAQLEPWKSLDIPMNTPDTAHAAVFIGSFPKLVDNRILSETLAQEAPELIFDHEIVYSSSAVSCAVIVTPLRQKELADNALRSLGFSKPLNPTSRTPSVKSARLKEKYERMKKSLKKYVQGLYRIVCLNLRTPVRMHRSSSETTPLLSRLKAS